MPDALRTRARFSLKRVRIVPVCGDRGRMETPVPGPMRLGPDHRRCERLCSSRGRWRPQSLGPTKGLEQEEPNGLAARELDILFSGLADQLGRKPEEPGPGPVGLSRAPASREHGWCEGLARAERQGPPSAAAVRCPQIVDGRPPGSDLDEFFDALFHDGPVVVTAAGRERTEPGDVREHMGSLVGAFGLVERILGWLCPSPLQGQEPAAVERATRRPDPDRQVLRDLLAFARAAPGVELSTNPVVVGDLEEIGHAEPLEARHRGPTEELPVEAYRDLLHPGPPRTHPHRLNAPHACIKSKSHTPSPRANTNEKGER